MLLIQPNNIYKFKLCQIFLPFAKITIKRWSFKTSPPKPIRYGRNTISLILFRYMRKLQVTQSNITRLQHKVNRMKTDVDNAYKACRQSKKDYKKLVDKIKIERRKAKSKETMDVLDKIISES